MKRRIAVVASSRATYGYEKGIIRRLHDSPGTELQLVVTGMHLLHEYGHSIDEIRADGVPIAAEVDMVVGGDTAAAWAKSLGVEIQGLAQVFSMLQPDIVLIAGDRAEMLATALTAAYMNIPVAHIQAGDVSGHIDGAARHAITKLSHIHFPSCEDSAERVRRLGEEEWRIFTVGAPQLDSIVNDPMLTDQELETELGVDVSVPTLLVIQHPLLVEMDQAYDQMITTMSAVAELGMQTIVIFPNIDAGGEQTIAAIREFTHLDHIHARRNLKRHAFISLLSRSRVLIGNSSCGILEAPSLKLPVVNIGDRQRGRMQAGNVLNVDHDRAAIVEAVQAALHDVDFRRRVSSCVNPYGDGRSSERIVRVLSEIDIDTKLLDKQITY